MLQLSHASRQIPGCHGLFPAPSFCSSFNIQICSPPSPPPTTNDWSDAPPPLPALQCTFLSLRPPYDLFNQTHFRLRKSASATDTQTNALLLGLSRDWHTCSMFMEIAAFCDTVEKVEVSLLQSGGKNYKTQKTSPCLC